MVISGAGAEVGTAVLLAAAPAGKGRLIDATSVLPALAAVAPGTLTGTATATVIELADPLDPQTVLTRIRAAAATPGPLFVYLAGQLQLDHKQSLFHFALARTTPATLRYTGLPWHWLVSEFKLRRPGTTTVVVDLVADAEAWRQIHTEGLALGYGARLYGRITPAPARRSAVTPAYLAACAAIWRSGMRPAPAELHEQAVARALAPGALFLASGASPVAAGAGLAAHTFHPPGAAAPAPLPRTPQETPPQEMPPAPWPTSPQPGRPADGGPVGHPAPDADPGPTEGGPADDGGRGAGPGAGGWAGPRAETAPSDPHPAILAAARAGRHTEAASIAATWESEALRSHGPGSAQAVHWLEVRADLARLADDAVRSCELWMAAAQSRLDRGEAPDDTDVEAAVDRAHHQWENVHDPARAQALAPALTALRRRVPGRRQGALQAIQRRF